MMNKSIFLFTLSALFFFISCRNDGVFPDKTTDGETSMDSLARRAGGIGDDQGNSIAVDKIGNIYIVGNFEGIATFDNITLTSAGHKDGFLAKYNPEGNIIWVKRFGGIFSDNIADIVIDKDENIYITGFIREADENGFQSKVFSFISKYDPSGIEQWIQKASSENGYAVAKSIAIDGNGNLFISGIFIRKVFFGEKEIDSESADAFLVKYSKDGIFQWVKVTNGIWQGGADIVADRDGNCYLIWELSDGAKLENTVIGPDGQVDMFIAKYNRDGTLLWVRNAGYPGGIVSPKGVSCDNSGNIYLTGELFQTAKFGNFTISAIGSQRKRDIFLSKMNGSGDFQWAKTLGGEWDDVGPAISLNEKGEVYVAGYSYNFAIRYGINLPRVPDPSLGSSDLLIAKYTHDGTLLWTKKDGGIYEDFVGGLTVSENGNIYIAGSFDTTTTLTGDTLTAPVNPMKLYNKDIFFAKYRE